MKNRRHIFAIIIAMAAMLFALFALPVAAAPTCQNIKGETMRCGIAGAMPAGWRLSAEQYRDLHGDQDASEFFKWLQAVCAVGVLFAIMAAMPDFEATHPGDWDTEENDPRQMP